jgi:hypothetical protein
LEVGQISIIGGLCDARDAELLSFMSRPRALKDDSAVSSYEIMMINVKTVIPECIKTFCGPLTRFI